MTSLSTGSARTPRNWSTACRSTRAPTLAFARFTEWWNVTRSMYQTVSAGGQELAKSTMGLSGSNTPLAGELTFTITEPTTIELPRDERGGGRREAGHLVAGGRRRRRQVRPRASAVDGRRRAAPRLNYTAGSWAPLAAALAQARDRCWPTRHATDAADRRAGGAPRSMGTQTSLVSLVVLQAAALRLASSLAGGGLHARGLGPPSPTRGRPPRRHSRTPDATQAEVASPTAVAPAPLHSWALTPVRPSRSTPSVLGGRPRWLAARARSRPTTPSGSWDSVRRRPGCRAGRARLGERPRERGSACGGCRQEDVTNATTDLRAAQAAPGARSRHWTATADDGGGAGRAPLHGREQLGALRRQRSPTAQVGPRSTPDATQHGGRRRAGFAARGSDRRTSTPYVDTGRPRRRPISLGRPARRAGLHAGVVGAQFRAGTRRRRRPCSTTPAATPVGRSARPPRALVAARDALVGVAARPGRRPTRSALCRRSSAPRPRSVAVGLHARVVGTDSPRH